MASYDTIPHLASGSLCRTFTVEAEKVWNDLGLAWGAGRVWDEETITNTLLGNVEGAHPYDVATVQFYKPQEKFNGADWEWWLTDGKLWLGLLIQAKRISIDSGKYTGINHKVGAAKIPQVDLLIQWAQPKGLDPLYVFYNYSQAAITKFQWNCGWRNTDTTLFGCTVAHAGAVKARLVQGGAGLPKMSVISYPLRCLTCCPVVSPTLPSSLPGRAAGIVRRLRGMGDHVDEIGEAVAGAPGLRDEPPDYVRQLLDKAPGDRRSLVEDLRRQVGPVRRLLVMAEHPAD